MTGVQTCALPISNKDYKMVQYLKLCAEEHAVPLPIMSNILNDVLTLENEKISDNVSRALGRFLPVIPLLFLAS